MFHGRGAVGHVAHGQNAVWKERVSVLKEVMAAVAPAHGQNAVRKERVSVLKEAIWPQSHRLTARTPSGRGSLDRA